MTAQPPAPPTCARCGQPKEHKNHEALNMYAHAFVAPGSSVAAPAEMQVKIEMEGPWRPLPYEFEDTAPAAVTSPGSGTETCLVCERDVPFTVEGICRRCDDTMGEIQRKVLVKLDYLHRLATPRPAPSDEALREALRVVENRVGCGDHSCIFRKPKVMGTNSGCRCVRRPGFAEAFAMLYRATAALSSPTTERREP